MKRREFITVLGGAAATWPLAARAQQPDRVRRIGVLMASAADDSESQARIAAFLQGLKQLGWADGRNVRIDTRWATTDADDIRRHAAELAALAPDVLVAATGTATAAPLLQAGLRGARRASTKTTRSAVLRRGQAPVRDSGQDGFLDPRGIRHRIW
jgi:DNA-binding LacI/PurR family transcriptional regulator